MNYCKYCDSDIKWVDRKPFNLDDTAHDYDFCRELKKQRKLSRRNSVVELFRPYALKIIQENARVVVERNFKQPENPWARKNQPIVVELLDGTSKVDWAAEYVGILKNGEKCRVHFYEGGGNIWSQATVKPFNKLKKYMTAFLQAQAEVNQ